MMSPDQFICSVRTRTAQTQKSVPGVRVQVVTMHSPEFYVTPTISLERLSIEQQRFPHSEEFFPCCSSLFFPWRNVEPLVLAALPHLCHPRAALAMEVVIKSLPHCFKRLGEHWERVEKRILTFVSCGQLGVFFPVSYFGNS